MIIGRRGKNHNLGRFESFHDAVEAYEQAAREEFGEFVRIS